MGVSSLQLGPGWAVIDDWCYWSIEERIERKVLLWFLLLGCMPKKWLGILFQSSIYIEAGPYEVATEKQVLNPFQHWMCRSEFTIDYACIYSQLYRFIGSFLEALRRSDTEAKHPAAHKSGVQSSWRNELTYHLLKSIVYKVLWPLVLRINRKLGSISHKGEFLNISDLGGYLFKDTLSVLYLLLKFSLDLSCLFHWPVKEKIDSLVQFIEATNANSPI